MQLSAHKIVHLKQAEGEIMSDISKNNQNFTRFSARIYTKKQKGDQIGRKWRGVSRTIKERDLGQKSRKEGADYGMPATAILKGMAVHMWAGSSI